MNLTNEQIRDIRAAVKYYMQRNISINNPRHSEYVEILEVLSNTIKPHN